MLATSFCSISDLSIEKFLLKPILVRNFILQITPMMILANRCLL